MLVVEKLRGDAWLSSDGWLSTWVEIFHFEAGWVLFGSLQVFGIKAVLKTGLVWKFVCPQQPIWWRKLEQAENLCVIPASWAGRTTPGRRLSTRRVLRARFLPEGGQWCTSWIGAESRGWCSCMEFSHFLGNFCFQSGGRGLGLRVCAGGEINEFLPEVSQKREFLQTCFTWALKFIVSRLVWHFYSALTVHIARSCTRLCGSCCFSSSKCVVLMLRWCYKPHEGLLHQNPSSAQGLVVKNRWKRFSWTDFVKALFVTKLCFCALCNIQKGKLIFPHASCSYLKVVYYFFSLQGGVRGGIYYLCMGLSYFCAYAAFVGNMLLLLLG